jgi:4-diphosphocytidyl-2-C-methyl-D-erythritol kinase
MALKALYDLAAPAKINLFLHVIGRRADGYHLLQSAFVLIDWCDTLHFERRDDGLLSRHDLAAKLPDDDLSLRAARLLQQRSATAWGVDITIDKQVPWGAGLGGGSSDAATTLIALNRLWGLGWTRAQLMSLGLELGADVPFFVGGHNAWVEGIGERLTPIAIPFMKLAVVKPAESLPTPEIFRSPLLVRDTAPAILAGFVADQFAQEVTVNMVKAHSNELSLDEVFAGWGRNDLQHAAESLCPSVAQAAQLLESRFGNSRMTGSGSAVFARVASADEGIGSMRPGQDGEQQDRRTNGRDSATDDEGAVDESSAIMPTPLEAGWSSRMCRSLELHPLAHWAG